MPINYETIDLPPSECFRILRWNADVNQVETLDAKIGQFRPMQGTGGQWHWHYEVEITLVESGNGVRVVGNETKEIAGDSDLVVLGRGLPHSWDFHGPSSGVCVQFSDTRIMNSLTDLGRTEMVKLVERAANGIEIPARFCEASIRILRGLAANIPTNHLETHGQLIQLLGTLASIHTQQARQISTIRFDNHQSIVNYVEMQKTVNWIMEHYDTDIQLQEVLDLVQMSKATFSRHFPKCTGVSFSQFVNQVRISNASRLLQTTLEPISVIAYRTGFSNLSNFNRIFLKLKGVSPSTYRQLEKARHKALPPTKSDSIR
ncbi:AraC family transcriptional regulator [Bremerella alba]|uniref:HTH-type transcriptional activator RhaR n=1 Tax=Bremerella alba TaxID=980252 RepID=A0A7V8V9Y9_9BACT|nr:AraC family transcriptional regulator [Bremerella alba]MBA2117679.1 HTH-type transcriptional activator RhaR [Bremerella alba]